MYDWKLAIVKNFQWRQAAEDYDKARICPMGAAKVAASNEAIMSAEHAVNFQFSDDYRDFLRHADGWPSFCQSLNLFGTTDFRSGESRRLLNNNRDATAFMNQLGYSSEDYVAVGGERSGPDLFLLISPHSTRLPGGVIWFDKEELERFDSFCEFFSSMIKLNWWFAKQARN